MRNEVEVTLSRMLLTPEGRKKLAYSMPSHIKCGGLDYIDGKPFYRSGGKLYTPEEFQKLDEDHQKKIQDEMNHQ
jgi:hypothetical protein